MRRYPGISNAIKHSIVSPSPFVPLGKLWKGSAHALCAAVEGEKVVPVCELDGVVTRVAELPTEELDIIETDDTEVKDVDDVENAEDVDIMEAEVSDIEFVVEGLSSRLTLLVVLSAFCVESPNI